MGKFKLIFVIFLICVLVSISFSQQLPTPWELKRGEPAPEDVFYFTENQFKLLLQWKGYHEIKEMEWTEKEEVYNEAIKDLAKQTRVPFFKSFKFGFIVGVSFIVLSVWAVGQLE